MNKETKTKKKKEYDTFSMTMELQKPLFVDEEIEERANKDNKKLKIKKNILKGIGIGIIVSGIGFFIWTSKSYEHKELATISLISDENVEIKKGDYISFTPKNVEPSKGFIFYPGAKVEPESYSPICRAIAEKGYEVVILDVPFNISIFGKNEAKDVIQDYPNISSWIVGGHSLGGVTASSFATENNSVDGIVLLSSYTNNDDLKKMGKEVLSIWGSKDGVLNFKKFVESKENLPENTTYVEIEGANHSQFGDYGLQKGDHEAIISVDEQMEKTYKNIVDFMENIN